MTATWNFSLTETSYRYESPPPPCSAVDNKPASSPLVVHNNPAQSFWAASVSLPKHTNHSTPAVLFTWAVTKPHASQGLGKGGNVRQWHRTLCSLQEWTIMPRVVAQMPCQQLKREKKCFLAHEFRRGNPLLWEEYDDKQRFSEWQSKGREKD